MPHRRNIDMDLLRSFVTIVETGSFTRAADRLLRTQSAISLQMKRLEDQLECRLFERGGRGVEPTEAGTILLGYARRILAANDELVGRMAEPAVAGPIRVLAPDHFLPDHLAPALGRFTRAFARVTIEVHCTPVPGWTPDLLFEETSADDQDVILREPLGWLAADGGWQGPPAESRPVPLVTEAGQGPGSVHVIATAALANAGIGWRVAVTAPSRSAVIAATACGLGVAVAPRASVPAGLRLVGPSEGLPPLPPRAIAMRRRCLPGTAPARLADFIRDLFQPALPIAA
jgi:DNA-binding transcriptional LysR family regulator